MPFWALIPAPKACLTARISVTVSAGDTGVDDRLLALHAQAMTRLRRDGIHGRIHAAQCPPSARFSLVPDRRTAPSAVCTIAATAT